MSFPTPVGSPAVSPSARRRQPYAIERAPFPDGIIYLAGFNGRGDWMVGVLLLPELYSEAYLEEMRQWMLVNDKGRPPGARPPLALTLL